MSTDTEKQALGPNQELWLTELESNKWSQQTQGGLHCGGGFCCLGVGAEVFKTQDTRITVSRRGTGYDGEFGFAPNYVVSALALHGAAGDGPEPNLSLASLNDSGVWSFKQIADLIRSDPAVYFSEPR